MVSAALQALESLYPQKFSPHPNLIIGFGILGAVLIITALFLWLRSHGQMLPSAPAPMSDRNEGSIAGRDNAGTMIGKVEHYHEAKKDEPHIQATPQAAPGFSIHPRVAHIVYELSPGCWKECPNDSKGAKRALLVDVVRDVPPPGPQSIHSVVVLAILKFTNIGTEHIPRAYWINRQDYRTGFIVGHKESLVIGAYEDPYLASYTNPQFGELMEDQFPIVPLRELGPRTIMPAIPFTVEISLWDWYANSTIQQNTVAVSFQEKRFLVTWTS